MAQRSLEVVFPPKAPIKCLYSAKDAEDLNSITPALIFTHGSGGTLQSDAVANFVNGFVSSPLNSSILCFQGNMNLKSRVKMFDAVIDAGNTQPELEMRTSPRCLGGRSSGARAASMAATDETTYLVLVSYPLHTDKEVRDEILLDLPETMRVVFISGDHDSMCDLERLEDVRTRMSCKTWRVVVQAADHGMNVKPKAATVEMGKATGRVVANWLASSDENLREGRVFWDAENEIAQWSEWSSKPQDSDTPATKKKDRSIKASKAELRPQRQDEKPRRKTPSRKRIQEIESEGANDDDKAAPKKRRKA